jgi:hypothetical protein
MGNARTIALKHAFPNFYHILQFVYFLFERHFFPLFFYAFGLTEAEGDAAGCLAFLLSVLSGSG